MIRFLHPEILWLLAGIPLLALLRGRKGSAPAILFSTTSIAQILATGRRSGPGRLLAAFKLLGLILIVFAAARPQLGNTTTEIEASGIDILLAVDVSGSMKAMDFTLDDNPTSRLNVVKKVVSQFIEDRPNDRIGLVAFAGKPYIVSPLTLDHDWLEKRLQSMTIGMIEDGTAIGSAIGSGVNRLKELKSKSRILILLTDGVNNGGKIPPLVAAEAAETMKIKVYAVGAGSRGEAPFPVTDRFGRQRLVRAKVDIDEKTLSRIAEITGGRYFRATDTKSLTKVYDEINKMETTTRTIKKFEHYRELFSYLIFAALALLCFSFMVQERRLP